jgi:hypothetical protein
MAEGAAVGYMVRRPGGIGRLTSLETCSEVRAETVETIVARVSKESIAARLSGSTLREYPVRLEHMWRSASGHVSVATADALRCAVSQSLGKIQRWVSVEVMSELLAPLHLWWTTPRQWSAIYSEPGY